jgi:hypothetical protein
LVRLVIVWNAFVWNDLVHRSVWFKVESFGAATGHQCHLEYGVSVCECVPFYGETTKVWNMSAPTPNNNNNNNNSGNGGQSGDCLEQDVAAAAAAASKNAFLELHQQAVNLHGSMVHHSPHMSHMSAGYQLGRSPYAGGPHSMAAHSNSAAAAAAAAAGHQLAGAYPFSHMTPQNSYSAAGYHHLSPYPTAQCPQSPPRDGRSNLSLPLKVFNLS